jgi:hypothetical protein
LKSFLLPVATDPQAFNPEGFANSDYLVMWPPGSTVGQDGTPQWMHWFQSRSGLEPADPGTVAFDYDMVFTFKSLRAWQSVQPVPLVPLREPLTATRAGARLAPPAGNYNGRPFGGR